MKLTWIDLNSWIFQLAGQTILVDPWLVDPMVFYGKPWLFTAYHMAPPAFTPATLPPIDLILLSQGLDDHCHPPTLEQLDRQIPVVASRTAAECVKKLGYQQVTALSPWENYLIGDLVQITATLGAELQPGQIENGYRLQDLTTGRSLYYEPHLFPVQAAAQIGAVDVAISPVIGQVFPLLGQLIMGPEQAVQMIQQLQPKVFLPTTRGEIRATGLLPKLTKSVGSLEDFRDRLSAANLPTQLIVPNPGETLEI